MNKIVQRISPSVWKFTDVMQIIDMLLYIVNQT